MRFVMSSPTLTEKVSKMIRQDILNGELTPGQKLVVADLKARYNVGASPIREALVQLSWSKYVKLEPQKGCWVSPVSKKELNDLYESLRVVSSVLLKKAIAAGDESWELDVLTSYHKLSRVQYVSEEFDCVEWEERHQQFHVALLEGADSENMFKFFDDLINQVKRYRFLAMSAESASDDLFNIDEHEMIMKLVLSKNVEQATELLDQHLLGSMKRIEEVIEAA
ncbi:MULTISPECIES: GntR family transcriptional regulator [unclassified Vibrio]|uniref:GntR family transcriptional regulator n=1 Tax=unclassified Vibrio TaxID=2614977 RepID=UPI0010BD233C|nr:MULTISPECIES: GntR family transcriptional regulator [unclassified Vibrio]NOH91892.1 FCD domain-containing protein [Vibrio sp. AIC-3]TKF67003.1 FCD domain-containing protein [Vibrio sp. F13]